MKLRDLTELAGRNLREAVLRNSLTTLGIAVGVASLVAMLSLGAGLQNLANRRLARSGLFNAIFVTSKSNLSAFRGFRRAERPKPGETKAARPLNEDARHALQKLPHVVGVYPDIRFPTEFHYDGNPYATVVAGIPQIDRNDGAFDGMQGSFFSGPTAHEAILQIELARQLAGHPDTLLGKDIVLRYAARQPLPALSGADNSSTDASTGFSLIPQKLSLRIIGIVTTEPVSGFGGMRRARLLIPLSVAQSLQVAETSNIQALLRPASAQHTYESLTVRVSSATRVQAAENAIKKMGFATFSLLDATRNLRLVFAVFDILLGIFGSLALIVASLGIINTLVMAILERRHEIGVLKALGAADRDIRGLFFAEASVMGLVGGVLGVAIGWLISLGMNFGTNLYLARQDLPAVTVSLVPWWMVASAIAFAIVVSLVAGIYPASRAAKLNPIEALRYE